MPPAVPKIDVVEPTIDIKPAGIGYREMNDAPCHLSAREAEVWASGWNAAVEAMQEAEKLSTTDPALEHISNFLDRIEGKL